MGDLRIPKGVTAIVTLSDGRVTATSSDFEPHGYGGFRLAEAQCLRAGDAAKRRAVVAFVGPAMAEWLGEYTVDRIWQDMRERGGARLTYVPIGYEGEDAEAIASRSERPRP